MLPTSVASTSGCGSFVKLAALLAVFAESSVAVHAGGDAGTDAAVALNAAGTLAEVSKKRLVRRERRSTPERSHSVVGNAVNVGALELTATANDQDCDHIPLTTTTTTSTPESLAGFRWALAMTAPCRINARDRLWELHAVDFHSAPCSSANATTIMQPWKVERSGDISPRYNVHLAFDGDMSTSWRGVEDDRRNIWVVGVFNYSARVRCVRFFQCACVRSARQVTLEVQAEWNSADWQSASCKNEVEFGEWTEIDI